MNELSWIFKARSYIGLTEVRGSKHNPTLIAMLKAMGKYSSESKAWWVDDETPWCGLFVGYTLGVSGRFVVKDWYRALEWESEHLTKLDKPAYGCIVTFNRKGGGHVGFVVGRDKFDNIMVLGGNQNNQVSIIPFDTDRVSAYYWPSFWRDGKCVKSAPDIGRYTLPLLQSNGQVSTNEA